MRSLVRKINFYCLVLFLFFPYSLIASQQIIINLEKIEISKLNEESGDELYFSIAKYSKTKSPILSRVPEFPIYWLSEQVDRINNTHIAEINLEKNESTQLIISLLEHDTPPLNVDDLIGSVKLTASLDKDGRISTEWGRSGYVDDTELQIVDKENLLFTFKGNGAVYSLKFGIIS